MNVALLILQVLLAAIFLLHGWALISPPEKMVDKFSQLPLPGNSAKLVGVLEVLGGIAMIVPAWTQLAPWLTPLAAAGFVVILLGALVFHARRREFPQAGAILVIAPMAAVVVVGRSEWF